MPASSERIAKAQDFGKDYYIYIVFEIKSKNPKIWVVQNPFLAKKVKLKPVQYKVSVSTIKNKSEEI